MSCVSSSVKEVIIINNQKQLKIGAIISYFAIFINIISGLVYTPWMIRMIGKSEYGIYTLASSLITLFLVDFGLSSATARFVSNYHAQHDEESVNCFLGLIYKFYAIIDLILFVSLTIVFFFVDSIYVKLTPWELHQFKVVYLIAASFSLVNLPFVTLNGIMTAYEQFIQLKLADLLYRLLLVGLTVIALLCGMGLYALVVCHTIAGLVIIAYKYIVIKRKTQIKVDFRYRNSYLAKEIVFFSLWTTISTLAARLIFNITPSILGIVANSDAIAVFGVVSTIEGFVYLITTAINGMFIPKISRIYVSEPDKPQEKFEPLMINVGRLQFGINSLLIVGFAIVGETFIFLLFGNEYKDAYLGILLVILPGVFFNSLQIGNTAMILQNKVKIQAIIAMICGVINVVLSVILSGRFGVLGACMSIFVAYSVRAILYHLAHHNIMKINIWRFIIKCYGRMLPSTLITIVVGLALNTFFKEETWLMLLVKGCSVVVVYMLTTYAFCLSWNEKKVLLQKIHLSPKSN